MLSRQGRAERGKLKLYLSTKIMIMILTEAYLSLPRLSCIGIPAIPTGMAGILARIHALCVELNVN